MRHVELWGLLREQKIPSNRYYFTVPALHQMLSQNLKRSLEISDMCQDILSSCVPVKRVLFINKNGRMVESKSDATCSPSGLSRQESEMLFMQMRLQMSMNTEFDDVLGKFSYSLVKRQHVLDFAFPLFDGVLLVTMNDPDGPIQQTADYISEVLQQHQFGMDGILDGRAISA